MKSITALLCLHVLGLFQVVVSDYQIEIKLIQYTNSAGRLQNENCCDADSQVVPGACDLFETCDLHFSFSIVNIDNPGISYSQQTQGAARYVDTNLLDFAQCSQLSSLTSTIHCNPLTFTIPSAEWTGTQTIRLRADITDYDPASLGAAQTFQEVASPILDITRPSAPSDDFKTTSTAAASVELSLGYRVVCTPGTCGSICSETIDCPQMTPVCENECAPDSQDTDSTTMVPTNLCVPNPCQNNAQGCTPVTQTTYECVCQEGFTGVNCEIDESAATMQTTAVTTGGMTADDSMTTASAGRGGLDTVPSVVTLFSLISLMLCLLI